MTFLVPCFLSRKIWFYFWCHLIILATHLQRIHSFEIRETKRYKNDDSNNKIKNIWCIGKCSLPPHTLTNRQVFHLLSKIKRRVTGSVDQSPHSYTISVSLLHFLPYSLHEVILLWPEHSTEKCWMQWSDVKFCLPLYPDSKTLYQLLYVYYVRIHHPGKTVHATTLTSILQ